MSFFDRDWSVERREMWALFAKRMHIEDLFFEDLFQTCQNFITIMGRCSKGWGQEIFFGDWMPEPEKIYLKEIRDENSGRIKNVS